ncbi:MAG: T9SS type A sorting domain-containing protein [Ignavibacteriae bacterium]|nr:T9SS type A sorting domain-containing protein [Ignavibacteriota bacterium]
MKRITSVFLLSILFVFNYVFPQTGWFQQSSGTNYELRSVCFVNANTGWAVGFYNTVLKTTNGGTNWFAQTTGVSNSFINCRFINSNTGWLAGESGIILKTTNSGTIWQNQSFSTSGRNFGLSFPDSLNGFLVGDYGRVLKTTNGGQNWQQKTIGITNHLVDVKFLNILTGWIVGDNGIICKTTDGGNTWSLQSSGITLNLQSCFFINENTGWIASDGGRILKTTNSGNVWETKYNYGSSIWLGCVFFPNANTGYVVGGNYSSANNPVLLKSTNGGENWFTQSSPVTAWFGSCFFINENTGWAVGKPGMIIKTVTGGLNTPAPPTLIYPSNGATNIPLTPAMTWSTVSGATSYKIQISSVSNFSIITDSATLSTNQRLVPAGRLAVSSTYFWRVNATGPVGTSPWSDVWYFSTTSVGISLISSVVPLDFKLYSNYPNPFNPATKIKFDLPKKSHTSLVVYDALGRAVQTLVNTELKEGTYEYTCDASKYNSGVYFVRIISDNFADTKKMVLIK